MIKVDDSLDVNTTEGLVARSVYPLTIPRLAGPGTMMTVVLLTENRHNDVIDQAYTVGVLALCLALIVLLFLAAGRISVRGARRIGRTWIVPATIRIEPGGRGPALGSSK